MGSYIAAVQKISIQNVCWILPKAEVVTDIFISKNCLFTIQIIIKLHMLSTELMEHISAIRKADYDFVTSPNPFFEINDSNYFEQLQLLLQMGLPSSFFFSIWLIQESQRLQFKNTTKYLAKKYFDIFLWKYPTFPSQNAILLIITCLRTAAKFNETVEVSDHYTLDYCISQSGGQYNRKDFLDCQIQLLMCLSFKLRITSPYDFVVVSDLLPHLRQAMNILNSIIDFALSVPILRAASAEGIFFGALLFSCKQKKELGLSFEIIKAITYRWEQAIQIAGILEGNLKSLLQE